MMTVGCLLRVVQRWDNVMDSLSPDFACIQKSWAMPAMIILVALRNVGNPTAWWMYYFCFGTLDEIAV